MRGVGVETSGFSLIKQIQGPDSVHDVAETYMLAAGPRMV
jgi:hypothetical protein